MLFNLMMNSEHIPVEPGNPHDNGDSNYAELQRQLAAERIAAAIEELDAGQAEVIAVFQKNTSVTLPSDESANV